MSPTCIALIRGAPSFAPSPRPVDIDHQVFFRAQFIFCEVTQNVAEGEPCCSRTLLRAIHRQLRWMQCCLGASVA